MQRLNFGLPVMERLGQAINQAQMERLHFLDGSGPYSIVTSGSACAVALEGLSPFSYVQIESNMNMSNNTSFRIISKAWERKS